MTASSTALRISTATEAHERLWSELSEALAAQRGGPAVLASWASIGVTSASTAVSAGWWFSREGHEDCCVALVRARCVNVVLVTHALRRAGHGRALLTSLIASVDGPRDGWALPGDRATKSLYEAVGWKARLLTMSGE